MTFWQRILSVETARFILALLALNFSGAAVFMLISGYADIDADKENLVAFALGSLFTLSTMAFGRYFGNSSSADPASGKTDDPIHLEKTE